MSRLIVTKDELDNMSEFDKGISKFIESTIPFYSTYYKSIQNYILLEGKTDKLFFEKVISKENNYLMCVEDVSSSCAPFKGDCKELWSSGKHAIIFIGSQINMNKQKYNIYGIVDRDFENEYPNMAYPRVYSDKTHDLETMLVHSDSNMLNKIFVYDKDKYNMALYLAYQLAIIKKRIHLSKFHDVPDQKIQNSSHVAHFIYNNKIDVSKFASYINNNSKSNNNIAKKSNKINIPLLLDIMRKNKEIDRNNLVELDYNKFVSFFPKDFYEVVNGHDLLNCFLFVYRMNYSNSAITEKTIQNYDLNNFSKTSLFSKLKDKNLL